MSRVVGLFFGTILLCSVLVDSVVAQDTSSTADSVQTWHEDAWTPIVEQEGVGVSYIFYPDADNDNNGVVLRLRNSNDVAVRYGFTIIFRAPNAERSASVEGHLDPGEMKTGDSEGLFWIPFPEGEHDIGEVGLRGLEITPIRGATLNGRAETG